MRENRLSGSMSGMWKRSMAAIVRHRQPKGSANRYAQPKPPRHFSTLRPYTISSSGSGALTLSNASGIAIIMNASATINSTVNFDNSFTVSGGHTLTIAGTTNFVGTDSVQIGNGAAAATTLQVAGGGGGTGNPAQIIFDSGTFEFTTSGQGLNQPVISTDNGTAVTNTFDAGGAANSQDISSSITQSHADTFVLQDGTIYLTGANASAFTAGTLQMGNGSSATTVDFGYNGSNNLPANGVTLAMNNATLTQASAAGPNGETVDTSANTISNAMTLTGANTINTGTAQNLTLAGNISGTGSLTANGDGVSDFNVIITGTDTYAGGTTIPINQTLRIGASGTTGSIIGNVLDNGVLAFTRSNAVSFSGIISGSGVLEQDGTGTLTLTGKNIYTGNTVVNNGTETLAIGAGGSIADSAEVLLQGTNSTFDISAGGNQTIQKLVGNAGATVNLGSNTLTEGAGGSSAFAGNITGTGGLTVAGTSTVFTLSGANAYSGGTSISAGDSLALSGSGSIQNSSVAVASGAIFDISQISGGGTSINGLSGAGTVALGAKGLLEDGSGSFSGVIQDSGIGGGSGGYLNKNGGASTLTLSGANTYTGRTLINGGTFALSGTGSIADSSSVVVQTGTTFDISQTAAGAAINNLSGAGTVALGARILTLNIGTTQAFTGVLQNGGLGAGTGGSVVKNGAGILTLSGNNTYTGGTTLNAGTLVAGNASAFGTGALTVTGGTLETTGAQAGSGATIGIHAASYSQSASGILALLAISSSNYDSIQLGSGAATLNGEVNLIFSGFTPASGQTYDVIKTTGAGTGNFSNIVLTNAGTLHATAAFDTGTGEVITIVSVPTLYWTGSTTGTGLADASGNWDTTGANTVWSSAATGGTPQAWANGDMASFGAGGTSPVTVTIDQSGVSASAITFNAMGTGGAYTIASGGTGDDLNLTGATTVTMNSNATISAPIVGTGALNVAGPDTLTLSGSNTYTGGTIINSGSTLNVTGSITGAVTDGGTFDVGNSLSITDLTGSGAINLGSNSLTINPTAADTFSGTPTGTFIFRVASNSLTLNGNLAGFSGIYDPINSGTLTLNATGLLNSAAVLESQNNGTLNVAESNLNGNVLDFFSNNVNGVINVTGSLASGTLGGINLLDTSGTTINTLDGGGNTYTLTVNGPITSNNATGSNTLILQDGTFVLASANNAADFVGNGTLQIGNNAGPFSTVQFASAANLPGSNIGINMEGGELQFTGSGTATIANSITDTNSNDIIDGGGLLNTLTLGSSITNATGSTLTVQNAAFILAGTNSSTFSGGSLQIGNGSIGGTVDFGSAANLPGPAVTIAMGKAALNYTGSSSIIVANPFTISTGSSNVIDANAQQLTLSNSITDTGGALVLQHGTFVLTGTNNGTGEFTGGTLQIGNGTVTTAVQFASAANMPASGATVAMDVGTLSYTGAGNIGINSPVTLAGADNINTGTGGDLTLFGTVTGTGSLTVNGDGTSNRILFIDNAASYTGTTTVTAGTLEFGGDTSGLTGNISDNALLAFLQSASSSVSGIISGTGSLVEQGGTATTLTLSGNNTYTGATTITSGTLQITGSTSGLTGAIADNSALIFAQTGNSSFGQVISGTGSVTQQGTATLTLSGANTYSGNTTVNAGGTLNVAGSLYQGAGHGNVLVNGTMDVANGFTVGSLTGTGTLDLTNTGSPLVVTSSSIFGGAVDGNGLLEASGTGITLTLNGLLAGFTGSLTSTNGGNIVVGTGAGQLASSVSLNITNNLSISLSYGTLSSAGNVVNFTGNTGAAGELLLTGTGSGTLGAVNITDTTGTTTNSIDGDGIGNTLTLNGPITSNNTGGSNTLLLQNGTFVLASGNNSASFIGNGTLQVGNGSSSSVVQFSNVTNLPNSGVAITLSKGTLDYTGASAITVANGISLTNATTNVLENTGGGDETITGNINSSVAGNTLAFSGGTFNLNESGSGPATFQIGDAPATVIVSNANAFGSGAVVVNSGSTLETSEALAQSGSTMAVNAGSYTQQANSTLALLVTSSSTTVGGSTNDSVSLGSGNASLAGNVNLVFANGSAPVKNAVYEVITTTGTVSGTQSVTLTGPGLTGAPTNLHGFASFDSGVGEIVTLETQYFANFTGFTPNETAVANYLNTNAIGPNTPPAIATVLNTVAGQSTSQQAAFLDSVTPQAYGQLEQQAIQNNIFLAQQVFEQVENAFDYGGWNTSGLTVLKTGQQDPFTVSLDAEMESAKQQAQNSALSMDAAAVPTSGTASQRNLFSGYVLGTITVDQLPENSGFPSQHFTTGSLLAGLDYRLTRNLMVGAIFNWGYTGATLDSYGSRQQSSSYTPGLVIGYKKKGFYANGLMSYTYNSYKINRNVASTTATGEPKSNEYDANLLTGYYFHVAKGLKAGPAVGLGYSHVNTGGSSETGSPFDLTMGSENTDSLRSLAGMQALYTFMPPHISLPISVNFNAFWQHEYLNTSRAITSSFTQLGGGSFLYNTPAPSRDSALLGLGASGYLTKNMSLFVNYETQIGDHNQFAQTVMAGVALRF